ncbi:thyroxine 5-deiodinase-like [Gigantopelta aegis]|uniref:thyroxine 5-deiodinase-like n=1 Tax=Gigantopelta aegis TaxID=1735272 RepID=UPI001B88C205|nr:thyroxine 5-deiodinase-like [Gigantopelta aegis]
MRKFKDMIRNYCDLADFVIVYIKESHPVDEWAVNNNKFTTRQHQSLADRSKASDNLVTEMTQYPPPVTCPVVLDTMDDEACRCYGGSPDRFYVILNDVVVYQSGMGPMFSPLGDVEIWFAAHMKTL